MQIRRGLLVQQCQLLAQLYLDWCLQRQKFNEPFTFVVPADALENTIHPDYIGVMITISPVKKRTGQIAGYHPMQIVQGILRTFGNKDYKSPQYDYVVPEANENNSNDNYLPSRETEDD